MPTDKFGVMEETAKKLVDEFFTTKRASISIKKYMDTDSEGRKFHAFDVTLRGKK